MNTLKEKYEEILNTYYINRDMAWGEVEDNFYTQEQYEVATKKIRDKTIDSLIVAMLKVLPKRTDSSDDPLSDIKTLLGGK
jgi:hypothetical protein